MPRSNNSSIEVFNRLSTGGPLMSPDGQLYRRNKIDSETFETLHAATTSDSSLPKNVSPTNDTFPHPYDEEVGDLSLKFENLQKQVELLTEAQASQDDRYQKSKRENDVLLAKVHSLEEQLRDIELNTEIRAKEDEKKFRETIAKQIKMQSQETDQQMHANYLLQQDIQKLRNELSKSEATIKTLLSEKLKLEQLLDEKDTELKSVDEELHQLKLKLKFLKEEESVKTNLITILNEQLENSSDQFRTDSRDSTSNYDRSQDESQEFDDPCDISSNKRFGESCGEARGRKLDLKSNSLYTSDSVILDGKAARIIEELESSLRETKEENHALKETNEDLQAQLLNMQLDEGRSLIQEGNKSYSLADEIGNIDVNQLMKALKEQQDDNARLRKYMEGLLLTIVEKNPDLLDKTASSVSNVTISSP